MVSQVIKALRSLQLLIATHQGKPLMSKNGHRIREESLVCNAIAAGAPPPVMWHEWIQI